MYLVSRIDGNTTADAIASIARAGNLVVNRKYAWIILDEDAIHSYDDDDYAGLFGSAPDYENTRTSCRPPGSTCSTTTRPFLRRHAVRAPLVAYASYGENASPAPAGDGTYINGLRFAPGAVFNTIESYNGRALNGLTTKFNQSRWRTSSPPGNVRGRQVGAVLVQPARQRVPAGAMLLRGMTWAEAA